MKTVPIYYGIYDKYQDALDSSIKHENLIECQYRSPHEKDRWIKRQSEFLIQARMGAQPRYSTLLSENFIFNLTSILDVGGGSGWLIENLTRSQMWKGLELYTVLELNEICLQFAKEHDNPIVNFIPNDSTQKLVSHDVLNMNSVLQYIYDTVYLEKIIKKSLPKIIIVDDTPMTESNSYFTNQLYYDSYLPVKFHSFQSIIELLAKFDYRIFSIKSDFTKLPKGYALKIEHEGQLIDAPKNYNLMFVEKKFYENSIKNNLKYYWPL